MATGTDDTGNVLLTVTCIYSKLLRKWSYLHRRHRVFLREIYSAGMYVIVCFRNVT